MMVCAVTDLPDPLSPSTASVSPRIEGVTHAVDRLGDAIARAELHVQVVHIQQVLAH